MFSSLHPLLWHKVGSCSIANTTCLSTLGDLAPFHPGILEVVGARDLGQRSGLDRRIITLSAMRKEALFNRRVFAVVPIYATSICMEHCLYCNYRAGNKGVNVERLRLSDAELEKEARYLIDVKGLRALELVYATDPYVRVDSMCRHIELLRGLLDDRGGGIVGINAEPFDEKDYRRLVEAGLSFAVLWQETYDRTRYMELHPGHTKKANFNYRIDAYERMIAGGIKAIGMGVLSGLADWRRDWTMLLQHETYIREKYGRGAAILGVPRLKPAAGAVIQNTSFVPSRDEFLSLIGLHNIFSPETLPFVNTREDWSMCVDLARGGGCMFTFNCSTIPGGYSLGHQGYQFPTGSYDVPVFSEKLQREGLIPMFNWTFENIAAADQTLREPGVYAESTPC